MAGTGPVDLRIGGDRIVEVGPGLTPVPDEETIDARGGAVIPGLHDHHVHLRAWAAAAASIVAGPPEVQTEEQLAVRLMAAVAELPSGQWVRAVGYHDSVAGSLDRGALDRLTSGADVPVRVQHRSGALWIFNSAGVEALRLEEDGLPDGIERDDRRRPTGRVWREDRWLADRLPRRPVDYGSIGRQAVAWGVTGFTDATPDQTGEDLAGLVAASEQGVLPQRLHLMAPRGVSSPDGRKVTLGPVKVMLDDHTLPSLDDLTATVQGARTNGRSVAVHCVTLVQATLALAAFEMAGPSGDGGHRIEHGAVLSPALIDTARRLGVTVVTQPGFVAARGDQYRVEVDPADQADLWRCASLLDAGVALAAGTDAPFGPADPWVAVRAATDRRTGNGHVLGPVERVPVGAALEMWTGRAERPGCPRTIGPGQPADLCVLAEPGPPAPVLATIVAGEVAYRVS